MLSNEKLAVPLFYLSLMTLAFVILAPIFDVYHFALTGAIFEILWLPAILLVITLPVISLFFWIRNGFHFKSRHFFTLLISIASVCILIFQ
ncbi:MAG: hypothetical protein IT254_07935 [Chitinophagaceae bacterium]|nr:hypothetical protein [Chitinophagaceae bacterium]MCW5916152.1 hypothetical protein [Ferruginibacter sp.]